LILISISIYILIKGLRQILLSKCITMETIINTPFENEIFETEYYPRDVKTKIKNIIRYADELDFKDSSLVVNQLKKLMRLLKYNKKLDKYVNQTSFRNKFNVGRYYQFGTGYQNLPSKVRNTLVDDGYVDCDMKNAFPVILNSVADKYKLKCPTLSKYVADRQFYFDDIMATYGVNRGDAKVLMLSLCFGGGLTKWEMDHSDTMMTTPQWLIDFVAELDNLATIIYDKKEMELVRKIVNKKRVDNPDIGLCVSNKKGSSLSILAQLIENNILMAVRKYIKTMFDNVYCHTVIFDGFLVWTEDKSRIEDVRKAINTFVFDTFDIAIEFEFKGFENNYTDRIQEFLDVDSKVMGCINENDVFNRVIDEFNDFVIVDKKLYGFKNGLWVDGFEVFFSVFEAIKDSLAVDEYDKDGLERKRSNKNWFEDGAKNRSFHTFINNNWKSLFSSFEDDNYFVKNQINSRGCLLFNNGTLMTRDKTLVFKEKFYKNKIFHKKYMFDYVAPNAADSFCDFEDINTVEKTFFGIYGRLADVLIEQIAVSWFGIPSKTFIFVIGEKNVGKSSLIAMIRNSLGNEAMGEFDIKNFEIAGKKNTNTHDALNYKWLLPLAEKRLVFSSEMTDGILDAELMKRFTSGGKDMFQARGLFKEAQSCCITATPISFGNSFPRINNVSDPALQERLKVIEVMKTFVKEVVDPDKQCPFIDDGELTRIINDGRFQDGFRHLLIGAYQSYLERGGFYETEDTMKLLQSGFDMNVDDEDEEIIDKLHEYIEATGDLENDWIFSHDLNTILEEADLGWISKKKKTKHFLKRLADGKDIDKTRNKYCREKKRACWAWLGLKVKESEKPYGCAIRTAGLLER